MTTPHVAVTGAAGYIGSRVVNDLRHEHPEWTVTAIDNFYLGTVRQVGEIEVDHVDIRHRGELETALEGADVIMHLAAISGVDDCREHPDLAYEVNVQGTNNIAWYCRKTGTALVFPFSMAVLGDPATFPVTIDLPRRPMNWYGRTKLMGEQLVGTLAEGAFPAHLLLKSNLYGEHRIDGTRISKNTVINFFVDRALSGEPLTVYEPGTQARNYIHVKDVAQAYLRSAEALLERQDRDETGVTAYEIASDEDPSVEAVAEQVAEIAQAEAGVEASIKLIENPRGDETLVDRFSVRTDRAQSELGWRPRNTIAESVTHLIRTRTGD